MAKDTTQVKTAGPNTRLLLAPVGATEPATIDADFGGAWDDMGFLSDPPAFARNRSTTDVEAWNAADPIRTLTQSDISTVELKLMQTNQEVLALYFGPLTFTTEGGGVSIEPDTAAADIEKAICLELVDGADKLRVFWRRCDVSTTGDWSMDKAAAIIYDVTLQRLAPAGATKAFRFQTNVASLVSA